MSEYDEESIRKFDRRLRKYDKEILKLIKKQRELAAMEVAEAYDNIDAAENLDEWLEDITRKKARYNRIRRIELKLKKKYWEHYGDDDENFDDEGYDDYF